jgi:hypothetical protein
MRPNDAQKGRQDHRRLARRPCPRVARYARVQPDAGRRRRTSPPPPGQRRAARLDPVHRRYVSPAQQVPEIERCVEPHGEIGKFLAARFKEYSDDHIGWSKEIWDMVPVGWLINPDWAPTVLVPTPTLTDQATWSVDRTRPPLRYATTVKRDPTLRDFFSKLKNLAAQGEIAASAGAPCEVAIGGASRRYQSCFASIGVGRDWKNGCQRQDLSRANRHRAPNSRRLGKPVSFAARQ